jgi:SAM-dependent methyltransferase
VEQALNRQPKNVLNIGCAEGYYAVGFGRRLPEARITVFDVDARSQALCCANAQKNKVLVTGLHAALVEKYWVEILQETQLLIMDCEGHEQHYLKNVNLDSCDLIIECHDFLRANISGEIRAALENTHRITLVCPDKRVCLTDSRFLDFLSYENKCLALSHVRPDGIVWLACWSHERSENLARPNS